MRRLVRLAVNGALTIVALYTLLAALGFIQGPMQGWKPSRLAIDIDPDAPTPQEMAESLNTHWLTFDQWHCRNVCAASKIVCRYRMCQDVPGVRRWD
ncbi:hypothetical protein P154DRAFT_519689 [Amniculicola lignicola CBS 123094]|uniref:Uncharacterized protein n=1 Tax=Amniculicola lignicola CBS 123094 TaxID=1392246 RepID=A0A6A5WRH2_9PLEO|nr:hypothetical protein P154DRAFT_519689 [Amniculicola lignicola CBS 123094]